MAKITPISGFPEWLPEQRIVEQSVLDGLRHRFELFGFAPVETRAVEPLEHLLAKGETSQEVYVLRRLQADEDEGDSGLGLHFDLTVPLARYVQQFRGQLAFPFKRYQIQKVWRGERPQRGRYREFYQADLDVVAQDVLPLHFDAEMARLLVESVASMPVPQLVLGVSNRKILQGAYESLGISDVAGTLRIVDKLDKVGEDGVRKMLVEAGLSESAADTCVALGRIRTPDGSFAGAVRALGVSGELLDAGLEELSAVMEALADLPSGSVVANLSIARGLDYYTGTVYEGQLVGHEDLGTVCSGGRYDDLVGGGSKLKLPGVGVSIGVTRMLGRFLGDGHLVASRKVPTCVLVTLPDESARGAARAITHALRERGIATESFHEPARFGKQIKYAQRRGIPYVWFPPAEEGAPHEVKDIRSGEQASADPTTWVPSMDDLLPSVDRQDSA
jgi:histidyl-tRNA synthetase